MYRCVQQSILAEITRAHRSRNEKKIIFSIKANLKLKITFSESAQKNDSNECNFDYFFLLK